MLALKKIKAGIPVGTEIPERQQYGNIGRWVESKMKDQGWEVTHGAGVDLPKYGVEIKSRKVESNSHHTVGTMSIDSIVVTPYEQSIIKEKFQQQYRVHYSDDQQVVISEELVDFSDKYIQNKIRDAYETGREQIIKNAQQGHHPTYVKGTEWGHFEKAQSKNSYRFRIPNNSMKKLEHVSKNSDIFERLFGE